jgi:hypothetical protein
MTTNLGQVGYKRRPCDKCKELQPIGGVEIRLSAVLKEHRRLGRGRGGLATVKPPPN